MPPPFEVRPDERISRFVFHSNHVAKRTKTIHPTRLLPQRRRRAEKGRLETSVCRPDALSDERFWAICASHFDPTIAPRRATGRCDALASVVFDVGLSFDPDGVPFPEHANIVGWYDQTNEPDERMKHFWMDQAQRMEPHFSFTARPN